MKARRLALAFEARHHVVRDIADLAERSDAKKMEGDDGVRSRVEIARSGVERGT